MKKDVIKQAYGKYWETVKDFVNSDGWMDVYEGRGILWGPVQDGRIYSRVYYLDFEFKDENMDDLIRPKSLAGIENNNGWNSIDEKGNPKSNRWVDVFTDGQIQYNIFYEKGKYHTLYSKIPTHWRTINQQEPLY